MTISLMPLPYAQGALAPHISAETVEVHYGAHHKGYVDKVNAAIEGSDLAGADLETIVRTAKKEGETGLFNSAAQTWNHGFYWLSMSPDASQPSDSLAAAIDASFGSMDEFKQKLAEAATGHFGSGWAWLVVNGDKLEVISTHDAETPITNGMNPLLTIDVWEHAYYLDAKNKRPAYVGAVLDNLLNWTFASENLERGTPWQYPG